MTKLLVNLFLKSKDDVKTQQGRKAYGQFAAFVGMACNIVLFIIKLIIGLLSASVSIMADAFNNLSDVCACLVTLFGFKLSSKPADKEHPFGHGRIEYMAGFIVAVAVILVGIELVKTSVNKIINPADISFSAVTIAVLAVTILIKLWMGLFYRKISKIIGSAAVNASATDSLSDVISTSAVLAAVLISRFTGYNLDGYMGIVVAVIIVVSGIKIAGDTLNPLLGQPPDKAFIDEICSRVLTHDLIIGIHDVVVHNYGPGRCYVSLHAEVSSNADINVIHEVIDNCEREISEAMNISIVIHMDPLAVDDEKIDSVKNQVQDVLKSIDGRLTMHDFRMVTGETHTNLIFDIVENNALTIRGDKLIDEIASRVKMIDEKYNCIINIDFDYTDQ